MSDSVQPHRLQPTRLPHPWDSPGKNTGVGCHFLLQCMKVKSESELAQLCPTLSDPMDWSPPGSSARGIFQARALEWGAIAIGGIILPATPLYLSLSTLQLSETKQYRRDSRGQPHGVLEWFSSLIALLPPCQFPSPLDEWGRGNITILPISKRGNS